MEEKKENIENIEEEEKCWICKRGLVDVLEEFNKRVLSNKYIDEDVKSRYEKGKKEFFPFSTDKTIEFLLADVKGDIYSVSGKAVGGIIIPLCPVCSGLLESISSGIYTEDFVTKKDLEDVSIWIKE